jgi:signal peptidase I
MGKYKDIISYFVIILVVVLVRLFIITPVKVDGSSMYSTLSDKDILVLKKFDKTIDRFDIVVINYEIDGKREKLVKRVIGLPGESIRISVTKVGSNYVSRIYVNGEYLEENYGIESIKEAGMASTEIKLESDEYFVLGDNRNNSSDSRIIGPVKRKNIVGVTDFRLFPLKKIGSIR